MAKTVIVNKNIYETLKNKNFVFFILCKLVKPHVNNFEIFASVYCYMRHLDNLVDDITNDTYFLGSHLNRQKYLIECMYEGKDVSIKTSDEMMLKIFIEYDISNECILRNSFLEMLDTLYFDLYRRNKILTRYDIDNYSFKMANSFVQFMFHFLKIKIDNPADIIALATTSCQAYMLRDLEEDIHNGLINIDKESILSCGIDISKLESHGVSQWINSQANKLYVQMDLIFTILSYKESFINKLIMLLFIEPRRYVLKRLIKNERCFIKSNKFGIIDYIRIFGSVIHLLLLGGRLQNAR